MEQAQLGHLPAAKHFHCSAETLQPILLSLMRETAVAPGLVTQEPGKSLGRQLNSPPVMHGLHAGHRCRRSMQCK